jgi:predicted ATPase
VVKHIQHNAATGLTRQAPEALGRVIERIASLGVLLLVTLRPEFAPPWIGQPHVTALILNRLPKRDIDAMIDSVVGNKLLPAILG